MHVRFHGDGATHARTEKTDALHAAGGRPAQEAGQEVVERAGPGAAGTEVAGHAYLSDGVHTGGSAGTDLHSVEEIGFIPESRRLKLVADVTLDPRTAGLSGPTRWRRRVAGSRRS